MKEWYSDNELGVFFDSTPNVGIRYYVPSMSTEERKAIEKYPFICKKELKVSLIDNKKGKNYIFSIPKGYCYDGASIPRFFWRVIGASTDNRFLVPALIHDVICEHHEYVNNDRSFSTNVFNALLKASGVNSLNRFCMKNSVGLFQTLFCNWQKI